MSAIPELDRRRHLALGVFAVIAAATAMVLGEHYVPRLPNHEGYFLVPVDDEVRAPRTSRPRHTAFILVDGLRADAAETMQSARALARAGQCRLSDQGPYTVSRPEYALLSAGLEVDRSGARNNELTTPLAAESVWQVAHAHGLRVAGSSHLPWFEQLFPDGFDRFVASRTHATDVFAAGGDLVDVNLFHPLYVDEAGHRHGAASPEYAAAVARADREIASLLARLDLTRDLVVLTADHGHRAEGGHGGAQPEIRHVLACFAGFGVTKAPEDERRAFDGRSTGPLLAVLLGLPYPRHMRAGDDGLDALWEIAREDPADAAYFADRRAAVLHFRDENRAALERWLGGPPGTWARLYAREGRRQATRAAVVALVVALVTAFVLRRRGGEWARSAAWLAGNVVALWVAHRIVLGEIDYTVINRKELFLVRAFGVTAMAAAASLALHWGLAVGKRRIGRLVDDWSLLVGLMLAASIGHIVVFGWPLGFPLPPAPLRYLPFFGSVALFGYSGLLAVLVAAEWLRSKGLVRSSRSPDR
jgi:hypothetical protein